MLSRFSWYEFITCVLAILALYYSFVLLRYYRRELLQIFTRASFLKTEPRTTNISHLNNPQQVEQLFADAMTLSDQVKNVCQEVHFQEGDTELLLYELQKKVAQFPSLYQTPFMVAINNLMQTQIDLYQFDPVDPQRITALWLKIKDKL